ncbi:hypothetical protein GQ55_7G293300 [Panicum hallii var. hallii]|uniref:Phytocyanin domain-containing protein n=1 Tax=Panicum hallii var. hallii TaxID=1504633 RepID=A0A2T7D0E5_9POAL|nr:hypothetical protein GQ55_7G293300 [Panicum hallii var. hallii]
MRMPASPFGRGVSASRRLQLQSFYPTPLQLRAPLPSIACARMSALAKALVALVAMAAVAELAAAKNHTIRWSASGNYGDWSASNTVSVGDSVVFTYGPPHTVDELPSEADYTACSFAGAVSSDSTGSTAFTFDRPGTRYFACATGSGGARHKQQQGPMTMSTEKVRKEIELQEPQSLY